jgi:hypothetical protein
MSAKQYEDYWRGIIAQEIEALPLLVTVRGDVLLGYAMALSDAANTARKWRDGNRLEPLEDDDVGEETHEGSDPLQEVSGGYGEDPRPFPRLVSSKHPAVGEEG